MAFTFAQIQAQANLTPARQKQTAGIPVAPAQTTPTVNLQPGQTGPEVQKLQQFLVSQGFMTQAQMNTGPGTYGPQTKAAVASFQQSRGIDTAGNPGFWGPRTIASLQTQQQPLQTGTQQPLVNDIFNNSKNAELINSLSSTDRVLFEQASKSLEKAIEGGKVVNPNIEISPAQLKQFYSQAETELDPFYKEQFATLKGDLDLSLARMNEDYTKSIQRAEDPFKQALAQQAEAEAGQGTAFSSERNRREATNILGQNQALGDAFEGVQRSGQDLLRGFEGQVGTDKARQINLPSFSPSTASAGGLTAGAPRQLDSGLSGGISFGTVGAARETALRGRQNQLEQSFRTNRVLDFSSF